ncbi:sensor histidine kinase [Nocardioides campestrisoli]|uniref:sensor histidine kinase n=1 Tax=Nocardioides campestrisoli TaxID=2736757 RepID=UPI0015E6E8FD|nr:histidine kinase [Nocardioides campestrisoli]
MERVRATITRRDWVLPAALAALGLLEVLTVGDLPRLPAMATVLVPCLLLVGRRRLPEVFATAAVLAVMFAPWIGVPDDALTAPLLFVFAGCFALGRYVPPWWRGASLLATVDLAFLVADADGVPPLAEALWVGALTFGPWFFGRIVREHAHRGDLLAAQAQRLVEEQRHVAERAVADERRRIARELHDVIAHSISVMVVQAGAARELLGRDEAGVARSLEEIERSGRGALAETGRLLGLLREETDDEVAPQPSARDLPRLVEEFRGAGLDVRLETVGNMDGLPAGLDLSLFRITEEALTNALKHTPGAEVRVCLRRAADRVEVDVVSTAGGESLGASGGHGLVGMRERVAVFGGSLTAGPNAEGGFSVAARLPVGDPA